MAVGDAPLIELETLVRADARVLSMDGFSATIADDKGWSSMASSILRRLSCGNDSIISSDGSILAFRFREEEDVDCV